MIFLSKNGQDEYIEMIAKGMGAGITSTEDFKYEDSNQPIVLRGILKHKIMQQCWRDGRDFYYVDTGYFGNEKTPSNPNGWKYWHRVVKNNLQHNEIIKRPNDRFKKFNKKINPWRKDGRAILIAKPDEKPCKFYNVNVDTWLEETIATIRKHTDRQIKIRERNPLRINRLTDSLTDALDNDVFCLVTFNSNAATESVFHGIPVFTLAPCHAAAPMGLQDLSKIETPFYPDDDHRYAWACHLAYGQFHTSEFKNGSMWKILNG